MKAKALYSVLSKKLVDNEILFVDTLSFDVPKTSDAKQVLEAFSGVKGFEELGTKKHNAALVVIPENASEIKKSFSNFGNVEVEETRNINVVDLLTYKYVIIADPKVSIETLEGKLVKKQ